ncbi:MAG: glycosyltransferase family 1 protein [Sulfitobacter sp.]
MSGNTQRVPWVIDASPLWEQQYTGISNVVWEIVRRVILEPDQEVHILAVDRIVPPELLDTCLADRSGRALQAVYSTLPRAERIMDILKKSGPVCGTVGLYLNKRAREKLFDWEAMMFYDFSPLLTPECHTEDTIRYHNEGICNQVALNDHMFCISKATARDLSWIFDVPDDKITVCLLGNSADETARKAAFDLIGDSELEPFLLMLGTIEPRKNITLVLDWLATHPEVLEAHRVVFAGRQGWGPSLSSQIRHFGLEEAVRAGRIVYLSYVSEAQKTALLAGAGALLFPSLFEGFGLPVLEAMGFDLPVLSTVSTSLPEVLGEAGYYFDPYDTSSLDAAYQRFCADSQSGALQDIIKFARIRAKTFHYDKTYTLLRDQLSEATSRMRTAK